jgi:hypothetical protein
MWAYQAFTGIEQEALDPLLTPVEVPAGHAVILDDALVHYSPPNLTQERRLAIQFVMVPAETPAYWFQQVGEDEAAIEVAVWEIEPQFFFDFWHGDGDERFAKPAGTMRVPNPVLELDGLLDLVAGRGGGRPAGAAVGPAAAPRRARPDLEAARVDRFARSPRRQGRVRLLSGVSTGVIPVETVDPGGPRMAASRSVAALPALRVTIKTTVGARFRSE